MVKQCKRNQTKYYSRLMAVGTQLYSIARIPISLLLNHLMSVTHPKFDFSLLNLETLFSKVNIIEPAGKVFVQFKEGILFVLGTPSQEKQKK